METSTASSSEASAKKTTLEDLSKEDLIKKCRSLLALAQKAKQAKASLTEENATLREKVRCTAVSDELIENLTQQKLTLVTSLEELKAQRKTLDGKLSACEDHLYTSETKIADLDTENQSCRRQIGRLTDENEQLITHLDGLEKQIEELKRIGLSQQQQLLILEKNNAALAESSCKEDSSGAMAELQTMLSVSLDEVKKLKNTNTELAEKLENADLLVKEKDKNIVSIGQELTLKSRSMQELQDLITQYKDEIEQLQTQQNTNNSEHLLDEITKLKSTINESAESIQLYQQEIEVKTKEIERHTNGADDLNTEIHKNRALIQKLKQDVATMSGKLKDNQIVSSGLTTDLENINEKLREKLKLYHSKIVKFAGDVKKLKESRDYILESFKTYNDQVKTWREQLIIGTQQLAKGINHDEKEKERLQKVIGDLNGRIGEMSVKKEELIQNTLEAIAESESRALLIAENKEINDKINVLNKEIQTLNIALHELKEEYEEEMKVVKEEHDKEKCTLISVHVNEISVIHNEYETKINAINMENSIKISEISSKCDSEVKTLKEELNNAIRLKDVNQDIAKENETNRVNIDALNSKIAEITEYLNEATVRNDELSKTVEDGKVIIEEDGKLIAHLKRAIEKLEKEVENSKSTETKLAEQSGQEIIKLANENKDLRDANSVLQAELEELRGKLVNAGDDEFEEKVNSMKRENAELLTEMNEMNQALKERGETISKQQAYCDEVLKKISVYEAQANKNLDTIAQNDETIKALKEELKRATENGDSSAKDGELQELRNEVVALKEKLSNLEGSQDCNYAESENLSTSTISRSEEVSRLKDLEGSWEERYGKLRTLALKLKRKIRELSAELFREQAEKSELQVKLTNAVKMVQTTQLQCDNLQDELDSCKTDNKDYSKKLDSLGLDMSRDKKQLGLNEETIKKLQSEIELLSKDKTNVESWKKQVSLKVQSLKKELEANSLVKKDFEARVQKLTGELELKEKELKEEREKHVQTKNSLQESTNERKKQSVLNLEIQDYERSIKDMSQKVDKKNELVTKLRNQIDSQKSTVSSVKEQNRLLEERAASLETELDAYRIEVNAFKKTIAELNAVVSEKDSKVQDVLKTVENGRSENEELNTQLSTVVSEHQKINNALKLEKDHLRSENMGLEQRLRETEDRMKLKEDELVNVREEYRGYKVRAQSVLRQNQSRDVGLEEKLTEEAATLRAQVGILKNEIAELKANIDKLSAENETLQMEKQSVDKSKIELSNDMDECRRDFEKLNSKYQQNILDNAETVRGLKIHTDTLAQCYRQQISEQEARHNREIIELQGRIERGSAPPDIPSLILPTTPREEGEGSESVESTNGNVHPLERLLGADQDHEISAMKKQLNDNESKVVHLTALLADTEQDLAKHVQMNNVLKEEIRRQQRSVEREKHAENLEYMKNVVFKFITLNSGDERQRMVPVLNTILKLSPEETNKLNMVARGDRSWSNYLPSWSTSKPQ